eukprot:1323807-Pyramimonas_sp.AAC.1
MSRRRWRQFSGRPSRLHRRHGRKGSKCGGKNRGRGLLGKGFHYEHDPTAAGAASSVPGAAPGFAGAAYQTGKKGRKGFGGGGGAGAGKGNPRDAQGNVLRCHACNSDRRLAREALAL